MPEGFSINDQIHELHLGKSFNSRNIVNFHSVRYDFKPASINSNQNSRIQIGQGNNLSVSVPHVGGNESTIFKGNIRPSQKECLLVIDNVTGEITIEKINSALQLKKTRSERKSPAENGNSDWPSGEKQNATTFNLFNSQQQRSSPKLAQHNNASDKNNGHRNSSKETSHKNDTMMSSSESGCSSDSDCDSPPSSAAMNGFSHQRPHSADHHHHDDAPATNSLWSDQRAAAADTELNDTLQNDSPPSSPGDSGLAGMPSMPSVPCNASMPSMPECTYDESSAYQQRWQKNFDANPTSSQEDKYNSNNTSYNSMLSQDLCLSEGSSSDDD